jgi:hypothetical protein
MANKNPAVGDQANEAKLNAFTEFESFGNVTVVFLRQMPGMSVGLDRLDL